MSATATTATAPDLWVRWRPMLGWWALSRLVTVGAFGILEALGPRGRLGATLFAEPLRVLGAWDGVWYARVAQHGYVLVPGSQSDPAFFPLLPIMMRVGKDLFGLPYVATGAIISNGALAVAVVGFYELTVRVLHDRTLARNAACFMAVTPMAFVFSMSYPESFALACTVCALVAAYHDRWIVAMVLAAAGVLARPEAIVLVIPLAALAWDRRTALSPTMRGCALAAVLAAPVAVLSYPLYLKWALHDGAAWGTAQKAWGRAFSLVGPYHALQGLPSKIGHLPVIGRDLIFFLVYLALVVYAARRGVPWAWIAGAALILVLPLFSGSFESEGRFGLLALPVYWAVAKIASSRPAMLAVQAASLALGCVFVIVLLPYLWP